MVGKKLKDIMNDLLDYITSNSDTYDLFDIASFKRKENINDNKSSFTYNSDLNEELPEQFQEHQEKIKKYLTPLKNRTEFIDDFVNKQMECIAENERSTDSFCWATELVLRIYEQKLNNKSEQQKKIKELRKKAVNYQGNEFDKIFGSKPNSVANWESEDVTKTENAIIDMFINYRSELKNQGISKKEILQKEKKLYQILDNWKVLGRENQVKEAYKSIYTKNPMNWRKKAGLVLLITAASLLPIKSEYKINHEKQYAALQELTEQIDYASLKGNILTITKVKPIKFKLEYEDVPAATTLLKKSDFAYEALIKMKKYFLNKIKSNEENKNEK